MSRAVAWPMLTAESGIDHYFKEIQRFPMLDPQEEYMLAKRWREDGDRDVKAAIQEYMLRSWSLVRMGTTANHSKLFFNLRKAKSRISALDDGATCARIKSSS